MKRFLSIFTKREPPLPETTVRILLVDDAEVNRYILRKYIEKVGMSVVIDDAHDGLIAIQLSSKDAYNIIFMDIQMPNMDGIQTTKRIKAESPKTVIIGTTGQSNPQLQKQVIDAGMLLCVSKPIDKHTVDCLLRHVLKRKKTE